jgi:hypothetical protein
MFSSGCASFAKGWTLQMTAVAPVQWSEIESDQLTDNARTRPRKWPVTIDPFGRSSTQHATDIFRIAEIIAVLRIRRT